MKKTYITILVLLVVVLLGFVFFYKPFINTTQAHSLIEQYGTQALTAKNPLICDTIPKNFSFEDFGGEGKGYWFTNYNPDFSYNCLIYYLYAGQDHQADALLRERGHDFQVDQYYSKKAEIDGNPDLCDYVKDTSAHASCLAFSTLDVQKCFLVPRGPGDYSRDTENCIFGVVLRNGDYKSCSLFHTDNSIYRDSDSKNHCLLMAVAAATSETDQGKICALLQSHADDPDHISPKRCVSSLFYSQWVLGYVENLPKKTGLRIDFLWP